MANPQVVQGQLNRLLGSVVYADFPALNVTAPYLSKEAINLAFEGETNLLIGTMVGAVTSPAPYIFATATIHLIRTQALAQAYKDQIELNTTMGSVSIVTDSTNLNAFQLNNCVLESLQEVQFDGLQAGLIVRLRGVYSTNSSMFAAGA